MGLYPALWENCFYATISDCMETRRSSGAWAAAAAHCPLGGFLTANAWERDAGLHGVSVAKETVYIPKG